MVGPFLILAAVALDAPAPASLRPAVSASAQATASIRVIAAVKFGQDYRDTVPGAARRGARLTDAAGQARPAELLEFQ